MTYRVEYETRATTSSAWRTMRSSSLTKVEAEEMAKHLRVWRLVRAKAGHASMAVGSVRVVAESLKTHQRGSSAPQSPIARAA